MPSSRTHVPTTMARSVVAATLASLVIGTGSAAGAPPMKPVKVTFTADLAERHRKPVPLGDFTVKVGMGGVRSDMGSNGYESARVTDLNVAITGGTLGNAELRFDNDGLMKGLARTVNLKGGKGVEGHAASVLLKNLGGGTVRFEVSIVRPVGPDLRGLRIVSTAGVLGLGAAETKRICPREFALGPFDVTVSCGGVGRSIPHDPKAQPTPARVSSFKVSIKGGDHGSAEFDFPRAAAAVEGYVKVATLKARDGFQQRCTLEILGTGPGWITFALSFDEV